MQHPIKTVTKIAATITALHLTAPSPALAENTGTIDASVLDKVGDKLLNVKNTLQDIKEPLPQTPDKNTSDTEQASLTPSPPPQPENQDVRSWQGSIMFPTRDIRNLEKVLEAYNKHQKFQGNTDTQNLTDDDGGFLDTLLENISGPTTDTTEETQSAAPTFYLGSILYFTPDNWVIWLNGKRLTTEDPTENIEIISVSENTAELSWYTDQLEVIAPNWKTKAEEVNQRNAPGNPLSINKNSGEVRIRLEPNQTFIATEMDIFEGDILGLAAHQSNAGNSSTEQNLPSENNAPYDSSNHRNKTLDNRFKEELESNLKARRGINDERAIADSLTDLYTGVGKVLVPDAMEEDPIEDDLLEDSTP